MQDYFRLALARHNGKDNFVKDIHTFMQMFRQLFEILSQKQRKKILVVFILIILSAVFEMLSVSAIMPFIQMLTEPERLMDKPYIHFVSSVLGLQSITQITIGIGIGIILVYILKNIFLFLSSCVRIKFSTDLTKDLAISVMNSYIHRPYEYFTVTNSSEILQGINGDVYSIEQIIGNILLFTMESMIIITISAYLFLTDPFMALGVIMLSGLCTLAIIIVFKKRLSHMGVINRQASMELNQISMHIANGIKDIYVLQKRDNFLKKFKYKEVQFAKTRLQYLIVGVIPERLIETVCIIGIIIVVLVRFINTTDMSGFVASLAVFAVATFRILPSISRISGYLNGLVFLRPALDAAYNNITAARAYTEQITQQQTDKDSDNNIRFQKEIKISHITWHYQQSNTNVLSDTSLIIKKGESVGIIGESGAGKSTLSDILLGLYIPQKGSITVDGQVITDIPKSWSRMMGYVPQTVFLLDDTVKANIAFGEDEIDEERVWKALEKASLKKFVEGLPEGLGTIVGEQGIKFSGGQRQRVAIARALYNQPDILILDEATSALDNETETAVMEAIESLQGTITLIIIAHRLTTIRNCDKIYEIANGQATLRPHEEIFY